MIRRIALTTFAMVAGLAGPASAQVKLEYKFPEGTSASHKVTTKVHQILTIAGMNLETDAEETVVATHTVGKRNPDGTLPVVQKIESIKTEIDLPGGINISYDTTKPDDKIAIPQLAFLGEVYKTLAGASYTVVLDENNHVKFVEGTEKVLAKLDGLDPKAAAIIKSRIQAETLKRAYERVYGNLPDILVRQGEPWERTEVSDIGSDQSLTFKKRYEYMGTVEKEGRTLDKINVKALEVAYAMAPESESPLKHEKSDLKIDSSDGTILFDRQAGTVVETNGKTRIKGEMTFKVGDMELPANLDLTFDTRSGLEPPSK